jgi:hypothetical protein
MNQQAYAVTSSRPEQWKSAVEDRLNAIRSSKKFEDWGPLFARVWHNFRGIPSKVLCELVRKCPEKFDSTDRNLRGELIEEYRKEILRETLVTDIIKSGHKFTTLLLMANSAGRVHYLRERGEVLCIFKTADAVIPKEIREQMTSLNGKNGRYTKEELLGAGYELKESDQYREIYAHPKYPLLRESVSLFTKKTESADPKEKAHQKAVKDNQRRARQLARSVNHNRGASSVKKESSGDKKSQKKK